MRYLLNLFKILDHLTLDINLLHNFEMLTTFRLLVEETGVPVTVFETFAPRFLPPPLGFLLACFVEVRLWLNLFLKVNVINIFCLHVGVVNLQR